MSAPGFLSTCDPSPAETFRLWEAIRRAVHNDGLARRAQGRPALIEYMALFVF